jgi:uncharacterized protein YkwD
VIKVGLCYFCGNEGETNSCPLCGIRFCAEHHPPKEHNCIAYKETSSFEVPEEPVPAPVPIREPEPVTTPIPVEASPRRQTKPRVPQKNKLTIAVILVAVSIVSIIGVVMLASGPRTLPGVGPSTADLELHSVALGQVNVHRYRNDLSELSYNSDNVAQTFADKLARSETLEHNPDLPSNTGENVALRAEGDQDPKITIALMVQDMVNNDDANGGANRANILGSGYTELSVGVAVQGNTVYLVLNFH